MNTAFPELTSLLSIERLHTLTDHDEKMLHALLAMTLQSNIADLQHARQLFKQSEWTELGKCIHRLSGAAQITGAQRAETACRKLEQVCSINHVELSRFSTLWADVQYSIEQLNGSIAAFLGNKCP